MKKIICYSLILLASIWGNSVSAQNAKDAQQAKKSEKIEAYYFHNTARCITCRAVELESKKDLESLYGNKVVFKSINIQDATNKEITKKLDISGQTLLIVIGDKKINLTNEGFMYARTNPVKLKEIIKAKVDELIAVK